MAGFAVVSAQAGTNSAVMITASRLDNLDLMAVNSAADVTVIDRAAIEESGAASVPELLRSEANVLVRGTSGNAKDAQVSMRGFGENAHLRTLVLVDGHRGNRPDMGGVGWASIPLSNIERVEVIRGGQNVLYGDRAVGGVIKITTKSGADAGRWLNLGVGSFDDYSLAVGTGGALGDLDYSVGFDGYETGGFRDHSSAWARSVFANAVWYAGDVDTVSFRLSHTDQRMELPGALDYAAMLQDASQSLANEDDVSREDDFWATAIWETERAWGAARVTSGLNYRDLAWMLGGIDAENRQVGFSLGPRVRWGDEETFWMSGLDLAYDTLDFECFASQSFSGLRRTTSEAELERLSISPYVFGQRPVSDRVLFNGGLRYETARTLGRNRDFIDDQLFPSYMGNRGVYVNPNYQAVPDLYPTNSYDGTLVKEGWAAEASVVFNYRPNHSFWLGYDLVYRYPVLDELAAYQGYALSDPLNENLDPETGNQFEAGAAGEAGAWRYACTAFFAAMDNEIVFEENTNNNTRLNTNLGATRRYGVESEASADFQTYGASIRWTLQDARLHGGEHSGNRVPLVPWNYGALTGWIQPEERVRLALTYAYVSEQFQGGDESNSSRKLEDYGLWSARVHVAFTERVRLELSVDNLLDEVYAAAAYSGAYYPGAGRNFRAELKVEF